jgi:hypothetical protein
MELPLHIAQKLQQLLTPGSSLPASLMKHTVVNKLLEDGILHKQQSSKQRALLFISEKEKLAAYLHNHFGITSLADYIEQLAKPGITRATAAAISGNSKLKTIRSFKGFLVNCYQPLAAVLNDREILLQPAEGSFTFISDYEQFSIDKTVTVVGLENAENFRQIKRQSYLFKDINPLFVCRYPQSHDLITWLKLIPNPYLHFGDLDFAGIEIYLSEFKKHLGDKASFFLPPGTEYLLQQYGNRALFNRQYNSNRQFPADAEERVKELHRLLLKYKMVLEQELFIDEPAAD